MIQAIRFQTLESESSASPHLDIPDPHSRLASHTRLATARQKLTLITPAEAEEEQGEIISFAPKVGS